MGCCASKDRSSNPPAPSSPARQERLAENAPFGGRVSDRWTESVSARLPGERSGASADVEEDATDVWGGSSPAIAMQSSFGSFAEPTGNCIDLSRSDEHLKWASESPHVQRPHPLGRLGSTASVQPDLSASRHIFKFLITPYVAESELLKKFRSITAKNDKTGFIGISDFCSILAYLAWNYAGIPDITPWREQISDQCLDIDPHWIPMISVFGLAKEALINIMLSLTPPDEIPDCYHRLSPKVNIGRFKFMVSLYLSSPLALTHIKCVVKEMGNNGGAYSWAKVQNAVHYTLRMVGVSNGDFVRQLGEDRTSLIYMKYLSMNSFTSPDDVARFVHMSLSVLLRGRAGSESYSSIGSARVDDDGKLRIAADLCTVNKLSALMSIPYWGQTVADGIASSSSVVFHTVIEVFIKVAMLSACDLHFFFPWVAFEWSRRGYHEAIPLGSVGGFVVHCVQHICDAFRYGGVLDSSGELTVHRFPTTTVQVGFPGVPKGDQEVSQVRAFSVTRVDENEQTGQSPRSPHSILSMQPEPFPDFQGAIDFAHTPMALFLVTWKAMQLVDVFSLGEVDVHDMQLIFLFVQSAMKVNLLGHKLTKHITPLMHARTLEFDEVQNVVYDVLLSLWGDGAHDIAPKDCMEDVVGEADRLTAALKHRPVVQKMVLEEINGSLDTHNDGITVEPSVVVSLVNRVLRRCGCKYDGLEVVVRRLVAAVSVVSRVPLLVLDQLVWLILKVFHRRLTRPADKAYKEWAQDLLMAEEHIPQSFSNLTTAKEEGIFDAFLAECISIDSAALTLSNASSHLTIPLENFVTSRRSPIRPTVVCSNGYRVGQAVEVWYGAKENRWYQGMVIERGSQTTYTVCFDNGEVAIGVNESNIRLRGGSEAPEFTLDNISCVLERLCRVVGVAPFIIAYKAFTVISASHVQTVTTLDYLELGATREQWMKYCSHTFDPFLHNWDGLQGGSVGHSSGSIRPIKWSTPRLQSRSQEMTLDAPRRLQLFLEVPGAIDSLSNEIALRLGLRKVEKASNMCYAVYLMLTIIGVDPINYSLPLARLAGAVPKQDFHEWCKNSIATISPPFKGPSKSQVTPLAGDETRVQALAERALYSVIGTGETLEWWAVIPVFRAFMRYLMPLLSEAGTMHSFEEEVMESFISESSTTGKLHRSTAVQWLSGRIDFLQSKISS
eukprot:Sspe_Gene.43740::Locus_21368_Transcript_1_1_Confidence_1.000_Length_3653::g.43740::m.43740